MTDLEDLARTPKLVSECCQALPADISNAFRTQAIGYARRAELERPSGRAPSTIAAAAIYLTGLRRESHVSQQRIADTIGVSTASLRNCYPELAAAEGIELARGRGHTATEEAQQ